jgi:general secretion pathway protein A
MYTTFYGLKEKPFDSTPDPRFLHLTPGHREALAQLVYSVRENRGFLVLTGEVGTGKTTLLNAFRRRLDGRAAVAFVFNSTQSFEELLEGVFVELGLKRPEGSMVQQLATLRSFMLERRRTGQTTVLIVDEAQNLAPKTLERIRLLSNLETPTEKLLQIVLVGQPELRARLDRPELRQLRERLELQCQLVPLSRTETQQYIEHRLRVAGAADLDLFTAPAQRRIAAYSGGIPRRINILCDHCLVIGYASNRRRIDSDIVVEAMAALQGRLGRAGGGSPPRVHARRDRWILGAGAVAAAIAAIAFSPLHVDSDSLLTLVREVRALLMP